jgi:hypothetical protein
LTARRPAKHPATGPATNPATRPAKEAANRAVTTALADWQKQNQTPVAATSESVARVEIIPPEPPASYPWTRAILTLVALGIAGLALFINGQTGWHFGTTPLAAITFMGLAVAADLLAILLPTTAAALWHVRRFGLAAGAWLVWATVASLAVLASLGFVELNTTDTAAARAATVATATSIAEQRQSAIEAARTAANTAAEARKAECNIRGARCRDREADERAALQALNAAIAVPVQAAPTIADPDPQVTASLRLATWTGLKVTAVDVINIRLALMALLPNLAGLVLAFAGGLTAARYRSN